MKKSLKVTLLSLCGIVAVLLAAVLVFVGIYFTRIQTMNSIEKLSDYDDGYNLYRMEVKYDYSLDDVISYGIKDNQTMIDAILKDALPLLPVKIEAPSFGCTAFTLTDADGDVHMGRNYDFKNNTSAMLVYCAPKNGYRSVATAALGRTLAAASMMGNALKSDGASLTLQFKGGGPLGTVLAVSDNEGNVRGYVTNPHVDLPLRPDGKLDVGAAVGHEGTLTVIKDLHMKEPYVGTIDLLGGEIAEDVAGYFVESEQIPTACALGVLVDRDQSVKAAGGYLIQLMPGAGEDVITKVEGGIMAAGPVSALLDKNDDPEQLLRDVMSDFDLKILETCPVSYKCYCSRERVERALISLGRNELEQMLAEQGGCQLTCQFCDAVYDFSAEDLKGLLKNM